MNAGTSIDRDASSLPAVWDSDDAWILQSVVYAGRAGDLAAIIGNADAINVDIPSRETIERSVRRLEAAGLVRPDGLRVRPTRAGKRVVRRSGRSRQGIREITPQIEAGLRQDVPFREPPGGWSLSDEGWEAAYDGYYRPERRA